MTAGVSCKLLGWQKPQQYSEFLFEGDSEEAQDSDESMLMIKHTATEVFQACQAVGNRAQPCLQESLGGVANSHFSPGLDAVPKILSFLFHRDFRRNPMKQLK